MSLCETLQAKFKIEREGKTKRNEVKWTDIMSVEHAFCGHVWNQLQQRQHVVDRCRQIGVDRYRQLA
jgi:hypothetical protein